MSDSDNQVRPNRNYTRFDAMSTEELKEILYQDSFLPAGEETDMDAILYIMEVVKKREEFQPAEEFTPVEEAWKTFNKHYRSEECDGTSLYEDSDEAETPKKDAVPNRTSEHSRPRKPFRSVLRAACIAAALVALLVAGSLTASAMGHNLWGAVAQWTKDTFGFTTGTALQEQASIYPEDNNPKDILLSNGIEGDFLPNWLPDGYSYSEIKIMKTPIRKTYEIIYCREQEKIIMSIVQVSNSSGRVYEKDSQAVAVYPAGKITHYIMQNLEELKIVWAIGNYECSIAGDISPNDAQKIIDSIYGS